MTEYCIAASGVISSAAGQFDPVYFTKAAVIPFVCAKCDNTHLAIIADDIAVCVSLSMPVEAAEALAGELVNPRPDPFAGRSHD